MKRFTYAEEMIQDKDGSETAKQVLNSIAKERHASIMVVGQHGRKGPKEDPTVMGSAVQYLSLHSVAPVLIIKDPKQRKDRPNGYNMGLCSDGSNRSFEALELMCQMRKPVDKIHVIVCEQANIDTEKIKKSISDTLEEKNCLDVSTIHILKSEYGKKAKDIIREFLMEKSDDYIDFIFVGNHGADFSG